jgi:hypothetical protein
VSTKSNGNESKYQKSVNDARAREAGATTGQDPGDDAAMVVLPKEAQSMLLRPTQADINEMMADEEMEFAPQIMKLDEGDMIVGILEGNGPPAEISSTDTAGRPIVNHVNTWIIAHPSGSMRLSILSSVQLEKKLKPFIGGLVKIRRLKDVKTGTGGRRVTEYVVCGPKLPGGQRRSWVDDSPRGVLDAESRSVDPSELPPGVAGALPGGEDARA